MFSTVALELNNTMGSGVVISEDGYILTAAHVVDGFTGAFDATFRVPDGEGGITTVQMSIPAANSLTA